jgi:hypothetical protein
VTTHLYMVTRLTCVEAIPPLLRTYPSYHDTKNLQDTVCFMLHDLRFGRTPVFNITVILLVRNSPSRGHENLIVIYLVKEFPPCMEPGCSLLCLREHGKGKVKAIPVLD